MSSLLQIYALGSLHELPRVYPALSTPWSRVGILSSPSPGWPPTSITSAETQHLQGLCLSLLIKWNWTIGSKFNKAELMCTAIPLLHHQEPQAHRHRFCFSKNLPKAHAFDGQFSENHIEIQILRLSFQVPSISPKCIFMAKLRRKKGSYEKQGWKTCHFRSCVVY